VLNIFFAQRVRLHNGIEYLPLVSSFSKDDSENISATQIGSQQVVSLTTTGTAQSVSIIGPDLNLTSSDSVMLVISSPRVDNKCGKDKGEYKISDFFSDGNDYPRSVRIWLARRDWCNCHRSFAPSPFLSLKDFKKSYKEPFPWKKLRERFFAKTIFRNWVGR